MPGNLRDVLVAHLDHIVGRKIVFIIVAVTAVSLRHLGNVWQLIFLYEILQREIIFRHHSLD